MSENMGTLGHEPGEAQEAPLVAPEAQAGPEPASEADRGPGDPGEEPLARAERIILETRERLSPWLYASLMELPKDYIRDTIRLRKQHYEAIKRIDQEIERLQNELHLHSEAIEKYDGILRLAQELPENSGGGWADLPRTDAILGVLREADGPLSPQQIAEGLREHLRRDTVAQVNGALPYLIRVKKIKRITRGKYAPA